LDERNAEEDKTVHWQITALWGGKKVELRETQRAVTPFGGLVVFLEFLRHVGYREAVSKYGENSEDPAHFSSHRFSEMLHELGPAARSSWAGRSFEFVQQQHR
jgi:hypothetical protein